MPKSLLLVLFLGIAFNSFPEISARYSVSRATDDNSDPSKKDNSVIDEPSYSFTTAAPSESSDNADDDDGDDELTGFPLQDLDEEGLSKLMDLEDESFFAEADVHVAKMHLLEDDHLRNTTGPLRRRKRVWPLVGAALRAGARYLATRGVRHLFTKFARTAVTKSGSRLTTHYAAKGTFRNALGDFARLLPSKVRPFSKNGIRGLTGRVGNHKVTVRTGSKPPNNRPTLEIRSKGNKVVRKFRYDN